MLVKTFFLIFIGWIIGMLCVGSYKIAILLTVVLISSFIIFFWSKMARSATAALVILLFFPLFPVHMGYDLVPGLMPVLKAQRFLMGIMLLFWFFKKKNIIQIVSEYPLTIFFIILFCLMFIAASLSVYMPSGILYMLSFIFEYYLFSVMIFDLTRDEKIKTQLLSYISISLFILSIIGFFEYFTKINIYTYVKPFRLGMAYAVTEQLREGALRIRASFDHSISYGVYLGMSVVATTYLLYTQKRKSRKLFYLTTILLACIAAFLTKSRIAIFFLCLYYFLFLLFEDRKKLIFIFLAISFLLIQPFFANEAKDKLFYTVKSVFLPFSYGMREMRDSAFARLDQTKIMLQAISKHPLFGYGRIYAPLRSIDNFFMLFAYHVGIPAMIIFLLILLKTMRIAFGIRITKFKSSYVTYSNCILAMIVGLIFVLGAVALESYFYLLWLYVGIIARIYVDTMQKKTIS